MNVALAALAGVLGAVGLVELAATGAAARTGTTGERGPGPLRRPLLLAAAALDVLRRLGGRLGAPTPPGDLAARLLAAGAPVRVGVADVMAVKAGAAAVALLVVLPLAPGLPGRLPFLGLLAAPLGGFLAPDLWLARRARRRARAMDAELADGLDLLRVAVEAGLPVGRALAEVGRRRRGVLAAEWRAAARELELGEPSEAVLSGLERRCPTAGMRALIVALRRSERHGAPLGRTLAAQARESRAARAQLVRERGARAAPKIQLAIAGLLVPSVLLLVAAALVAGLEPAG